ncbi:VOC family protein [Spirillospora sp. NPDC127200]
MNIVATNVAVRVADLAASSRFFVNHLGFREVVETDEFVCLARDDAAADITLHKGAAEDAPGAPRRPDAPPVVVSFSVTDIVAEHERLRSEGASLTAPLRRAPWGEWSLRLTDPSGLVVELVEWAAPAGA